jgi:hypothetical protein
VGWVRTVPESPIKSPWVTFPWVHRILTLCRWLGTDLPTSVLHPTEGPDEDLSPYVGTYNACLRRRFEGVSQGSVRLTRQNLDGYTGRWVPLDRLSLKSTWIPRVDPKSDCSQGWKPMTPPRRQDQVVTDWEFKSQEEWSYGLVNPTTTLICSSSVSDIYIHTHTHTHCREGPTHSSPTP